MTQSTHRKGSAPALIAAIGVLLLAIVLLDLNIILSLLLAAVAYFGVARLSSAEPPSNDTNATRSAPARAAETPAPPANDVSAPASQPTTASPDAPSEAPAEANDAPMAMKEMAGQVKLGTLLPGEKELAARGGAWRYKA